MKIGILTTFGGSDEAYSLVVVVKTQLQMLANYHPALFVCPSFSGEGVFSDQQTDIRRTVTGEAKAEEITQALDPLVGDIDVMLCHDIVFLSQHSEWAQAICEIGKRHPHIAWVHWQHSRGDGKTHDHPSNSWFAYPNQGDLQHCADINGVDVERVRYVPHPLDFNYLGWPELAIRIAQDTAYPFADVSGVLPARLDRHKQVELAVRIFAALKRAGRTVCFLISDAFATGERFLQYKEDVKAIAREQGLTDKEFIFLGERYEECRYGTPRQVVKALYEMGNLFIQPSNAETSSLVAMEAALAGNLVIINADFPPIHHLYKRALALPFGSVLEPTKYFRHIKTADGSEIKVEDPQQFWDDQARITILPALDSQIVLQVKRQQYTDRWPSRVLDNYMLPLIQEAYDATPHVVQAHGYDPEVTAIITTLDNLEMLKKQIPILLDECGHVIVVNNGSIDGTRDWLMDNTLARVSYINRANLGAGPGRNDGLDMWNGSTPYILMVDGGILPPIGGVPALKAYMQRHPDADVISPEVASCFTTEEAAATLRVTVESIPDHTFLQRCLSSTAYCLTNRRAWDGLRFSEEGPFGEPGWGADDNEMAYRWDEAGIMHHEFTHSESGWSLYRRASGSFKRLYEETTVWPNQYGSVYEKRCVKLLQDYRALHAPMQGWTGAPTASYVIQDVPMPWFAKLVKYLHDRDVNCEVLVESDYDPYVALWLDTFALRWPWGNCAFAPDGKKLIRGEDYPEELWSGNVIRNRGPHTDALIITPENIDTFFEAGEPQENAFFKVGDQSATEIEGYPIPPEWWSRVYEYPWALEYAEPGLVVADMGCGWEFRPFKDALAKTCGKVYAVDQHWEIRNQQPHANMEFVVADFTRKVEAIADASLDRVFCISVAEETGDSLPLALQEFYRCLKPGGLCVLTCDVRYDLDKPPGPYQAVKISWLEESAREIGFQFDPFNLGKDGAVNNPALNLCVFHCVLRKP